MATRARKLRRERERGIVGAAATLKEPVVVPDVNRRSALPDGEPGDAFGTGDSHEHKGKVIGVLDLESPQLNYFTEDHGRRFRSWLANSLFSLEMRAFTKIGEGRSPAGAGFAGGKENSGGAAAAGAHGRLRIGDGRPVSFRTGSVRRPLRVSSALRTAAVGDCAGRRERQGDGCGTLMARWPSESCGSGAAKNCTCGNAEANEQLVGEAGASRGVFWVLALAKRGAEVASGKRRAIAAVAIQRRTLRQD